MDLPPMASHSRARYFRFLRWFPVASATILMVIVAAAAVYIRSELKNATGWRQHTVEVILAANAFQDRWIDIQRNARDYVTTGHANALTNFEFNITREAGQYDRLLQLTRDNPAQQQRLKQLGERTSALLAYDHNLIRICQQQGQASALKADPAGTEGRLLFSTVRDILKEFSGTEQQLLQVRSDDEQAHYHQAGRLVIAGSVVAMILILFANFVASRELAFRQRAEAHLSRTLMLQKAVFNSADHAIVTTDPAGIIQTYNPAAERLLGYSADEVIGKFTPMVWRDPREVAERAARLSEKLGRPVHPTFEAVAAKIQADHIDDGEWTYIRKDGGRFSVSLVVTALADQDGNFTGYLGMFRDISARKHLEAEREKLILDLKNALAEVKTLSGMIPICAWCKSVRNDQGYWSTVEQYVKSRTDATFSHSMCPSCQEKFKADIARVNAQKPAG